MLDFSEALGYNPGNSLQTVGGALMQAKQRYINSLGDGGLTAYDEKVVAKSTLYGLPMLGVSMPIQTSQLPGGNSVSPGTPLPLGAPANAQAWEQNLGFTYQDHNVNTADRSGTYYTVNNEDGVQATGNRPVLPQTTINIGSAVNIAHGVLMAGGAFTDTANNPVIAQIIDQENTLTQENIYLSQSLYPVSPAASTVS